VKLYKNFHFLVETIIHDERVTHAYASGLHPRSKSKIYLPRLYMIWNARMARAVVEPSDIRVEKVTLKPTYNQSNCYGVHMEEYTYNALLLAFTFNRDHLF
jgi:Leu/Phe-tRNA-protein transferase